MDADADRVQESEAAAGEVKPRQVRALSADWVGEYAPDQGEASGWTKVIQVKCPRDACSADSDAVGIEFAMTAEKQFPE
ncbi:hypothetical protein [Amycolatopsis sp. H20-H5]|uniref:hypothetical protein n=1 Tax=Amycolatopsis sp. H20-H5 TaxID=3046309 RepID=UPI002DBB7478|nr:hypothetical protein [Amycolatopsis sp. H20-H5]MEC3974331.1 hypothetical protein [Amycolatopsis sp. H20-H5]